MGSLSLDNCTNSVWREDSPTVPQAGCARLLYHPSYLCISAIKNVFVFEFRWPLYENTLVPPIQKSLHVTFIDLGREREREGEWEREREWGREREREMIKLKLLTSFFGCLAKRRDTKYDNKYKSNGNKHFVSQESFDSRFLWLKITEKTLI